MKSILRQAGLLVVFAALWYLILYAGYYIYEEWTRPPVDTICFVEAYRTLSLDACRLQRNERPKLIVLGSSNALFGFRPDELQPLFPQYEAANLSLPGSNMTDTRQVIELLEQLLPAHVKDKSLFVIGIFYGSVYGNGHNVNEALVESRLYRWNGDGIRPIVPAQRVDLLVRVLRPVLVLNRPLKNSLSFFHSLSSNRPAAAEAAPPAVIRQPSGEKIVQIDRNQWKQRTDNTDSRCRFENEERGFEELVRVCDLIQSCGGKLLLVDLPLPEWHQNVSEYHEKYQAQKQQHLAEALRYPSVYYVNLLENEKLCDERNYLDATHPGPVAATLWSKTLRQRWEDFSVAASGDPHDSGAVQKSGLF
ncbi:MAG: hypothetical protein C4520_15250 [Candidatus Abyssobacteria bacterium SURF_5]|uniref:Uncharacterized protein n=1 Tax=Abyssobacteria bacterium (strain SURF_5) TaxID=2093360 RepID=A0A3A4NR06_ABYX5|nr:MAG: hypothetical protein C4520_15250 [Candidatus Abyssubacteria bacterium SURF_5]